MDIATKLNDNFLNTLFDELRLSKAQICALHNTIEAMKKEQLELKESVRLLEQQTLERVALEPQPHRTLASIHTHTTTAHVVPENISNPHTLKSLAFHSFGKMKFSHALEQYLQKYPSHIKTITVLKVHERVLIPVMIIPTLPKENDPDPWKENKRKEFYKKMQDDFVTAYESSVSFGEAFTYVTTDKTYKTAQEFVVDVAIRVNVASQHSCSGILYHLIIDSISIGFGREILHDALRNRRVETDGSWQCVIMNARSVRQNNIWINEKYLNIVHTSFCWPQHIRGSVINKRLLK